MFKYILALLTSFIIFNAYADNSKKIIENLNKIKNFDFKFEQNINGKIESGNCTIEYPKKIFCEYERSNNKLLVSNGRSLVIKSRSSYYIYPLHKTPLNFILDKKFLIEKITNLEERVIDGNLINYTITEDHNELNIFFDNKTFDLIGWQNRDIYQNYNITYLSSIRKNRIIPKKLFQLPTRD
tara:strand:+ start:828 stop:1376 length:549 start_codon:yes stop_codon:yes gene_type:complete